MELPPIFRSRRFRISLAILGLVWVILCCLAENSAWVKTTADTLIEGAQAIDPFVLTREFLNAYSGENRLPPSLQTRKDPKPDPPLEISFIDIYRDPDERAPRWDETLWADFKAWVRPAPEPRTELPPRMDVVRAFRGLRMALVKALDGGWPAVPPLLLSIFIGLAITENVFGSGPNRINPGFLIHPGALVIFLLVVVGLAGVAAFLIQQILTLLLNVLGSSAVLVGYAAPFVLGIQALVIPLFEFKEKVKNVVELVQSPDDEATPKPS